MNFLDRIEAYCKEFGLSQSSFERAAGLTKGQITKWKNGLHPGLKSQRKIAEYMQMSLEELMRETPASYEGDPMLHFDPDALRDHSALYIPVIKNCSGLDFARLRRGEVSKPAPHQNIRLLPPSVANPFDCFGFEMYDNSMVPYFDRGDIVLADGSDKGRRNVCTGDIVIVSTPGEPSVCRKLIKDDTGIILQPVNSSFDAVHYLNSEIEDLPVAITGKVVSLIRTIEPPERKRAED